MHTCHCTEYFYLPNGSTVGLCLNTIKLPSFDIVCVLVQHWVHCTIICISLIIRQQNTLKNSIIYTSLLVLFCQFFRSHTIDGSFHTLFENIIYNTSFSSDIETQASPRHINLIIFRSCSSRKPARQECSRLCTTPQPSTAPARILLLLLLVCYPRRLLRPIIFNARATQSPWPLSHEIIPGE